MNISIIVALLLTWLGRVIPRRHPAPKVVERVEASGAAIARTDQLDSLRFVANGRRLWVAAERP